MNNTRFFFKFYGTLAFHNNYIHVRTLNKETEFSPRLKCVQCFTECCCRYFGDVIGRESLPIFISSSSAQGFLGLLEDRGKWVPRWAGRDLGGGRGWQDRSSIALGLLLDSVCGSSEKCST